MVMRGQGCLIKAAGFANYRFLICINVLPVRIHLTGRELAAFYRARVPVIRPVGAPFFGPHVFMHRTQRNRNLCLEFFRIFHILQCGKVKRTKEYIVPCGIRIVFFAGPFNRH